MTELVVSASPFSNHHLNYRPLSVLLIAGVPAIGDFLFGLDIGVTSYAMSLWKQQASEISSGSSSPPFLLWLLGMLVSAPSAGAFVASFFVFRLSSSRSRNNSTATTTAPVGPKRELQIAASLYLVGSFLSCCHRSISTTIYSSSSSSPLFLVLLLLVARWIYGGGIAFGLHGATTYMGDMLPAAIRGSFMSLNEVSIVAGVLGGYLVGYCTTTTSTPDSLSFLMYVPALCLSAIMAWLSTMHLAESARWLALQGRTEEAREAWNFVWKESRDRNRSDDDNDNYDNEHEESTTPRGVPLWLSNAETSAETIPISPPPPPPPFSYKVLLDPKHRPALVAGWGLVVLLQLTGQPTVLSYATTIIHQQMGLSASTTVVLATFKIFMTLLVTVACADRFGRKTLLFVGCSAMWMGLAVLTVMTYAHPASLATSDNSNPDYHENKESDNNISRNSSSPSVVSQLLVLVMLLLFIGGYQIGFGTMIWLVTTELFASPIIRGPAVAVAVQLNFATHAMVECLVPLIGRRQQLSNVFLVFWMATTASTWFIHHHVPETKGLTLEEIEEQLLYMSNRRTTTTSASLHNHDDDERVPIYSNGTS